MRWLTIPTLALSLLAAPVRADQSCGAVNCDFKVKIPFTYFIETASSLSLSMPPGNLLRFNQNGIYGSTGQGWVAPRRGSLTALSCNFEVFNFIAAGVLTFQFNASLGPWTSGPNFEVPVFSTTSIPADGFYNFLWTVTDVGGYPLNEDDRPITFRVDPDGTFDGDLRRWHCVGEFSGFIDIP